MYFFGFVEAVEICGDGPVFGQATEFVVFFSVVVCGVGHNGVELVVAAVIGGVFVLDEFLIPSLA